MAMMRIAIAGTNGLARLIAHFIHQETSHSVVLLSRELNIELSGSCQVAVVDYNNPHSLQYALRGIDTVISTVTGHNQIALIHAAVVARVRRFAPAEYEGLPYPNNPLDRGRTEARECLYLHRQSIETTTFVCGILYERFQPGGLQSSHLGLTSGLAGEGAYIMNCRTMEAQVPYYNANNHDVMICMTAAQDVARFVTRAIDMRQRWPAVLKMCGQRVAVRDLVQMVQQLRGAAFHPHQVHNPASLHSALQLATFRGDVGSQVQLHALIATTQGYYDFLQTASDSLNDYFPDVRPIAFRDWFIAQWSVRA